jgi:hypothetical protein
MTISSAGLRQALDQLAELRQGDATVDDSLQRAVTSADALFGADGTALLLLDHDQSLRSVTVSDRRMRTLEDLEIEHGEGPCIDAFDFKQVVSVEDLTAERRWPRFSPAAVADGLSAVLASPIPHSEDGLGVLAVCAATPHPWQASDHQALAAFTDLAALLILKAMQATQRGRLAGELQGALRSRVVIEQAKGVLIGRHGLTARQAFERLRGQARDQRRPLSEVAAAVVAAAQRG